MSGTFVKSSVRRRRLPGLTTSKTKASRFLNKPDQFPNSNVARASLRADHPASEGGPAGMTALEPVVTTKRANVGGSNRRSFAAEWAVYKTILEAGHALGWPFALPSKPFGLVMIEAMAYGKSVIALHCGSVPEVIENGTTGFVVNRCLVVVRQGCILKAIWARSTNELHLRLRGAPICSRLAEFGCTCAHRSHSY
jgi:Glycosyl transferases group 1